MFDIGWSELLIIGIVALIAIGPKELPGVLRAAGHWMGKIRRMASEFQDQFREAMREAEVADLKKQVDDLTNTASGYTNFDPLGDVKKELDEYGMEKPVETPPPAPTAEAAAPAADAAPRPPEGADAAAAGPAAPAKTPEKTPEKTGGAA